MQLLLGLHLDDAEPHPSFARLGTKGVPRTRALATSAVLFQDTVRRVFCLAASQQAWYASMAFAEVDEQAMNHLMQRSTRKMCRLAANSADPVAERLVLAMVAEGLGQACLEALPQGVCMPLLDAIRSCRHRAPQHWPVEALRLVGREDLARQMELHGHRESATPTILPAPPVVSFSSDARDVDGMQALIAKSTLRFSRDLRLHEVRRLLCSSRPVALRIDGSGIDLSEHDLIHEQQTRLALLCRRSMALPIGRGMFTLASAPAQLTEALRIAPLILKGHTSPNAATIDMDVSALPADHLMWPEFHNGAAAAMRLSPPDCGRKDTGELGRQWIVYNRPRAQQHAHAGLLLGLGLQGHLLALANTDLYRYMSQGHAVTMMAVLLGMAAARRGSMHHAIAKMLCLHVPALHPPSFTELELEVPALVQIAALLGIGLLYQGCAHRLMTEVLLGEIGRQPTNELMGCRESYSLTAGIALGMLGLGHGSDAAGLADLQLEDKLGTYMHGQDPALPFFLDDAGLRPPQGLATSRCYRIREGPTINIDVTAAGATLALGLIFLKSNNSSVAAQLRLPQTMFALHSVRPDLILLRVVARGLIMWDDVRPTKTWFTSQLTPLMRSPRGIAPVEREDEEAVRLANVNSAAGASVALGLRFAGSCCKPACEMLMEQVRELHSLRQACGGRNSRKAGKPTLEACLAATAIAMSMVMAGSGNLRCLRLLRVLRRRVDPEVSCGFHMALSMGMGFLFLGGGRLTLGTSNTAVAALLASIFPRFPSSTSDNRYHLQAFRHLYALAAEARCLEAIDVETGQAALVPIRVDMISRAPSLKKVTPCILPPLNTIARLHVESPRYWKRNLALSESGKHASILQRRIMWVKRRTGHLPHNVDPQGLSSMWCRPFAPTLTETGCVLHVFCDEPMLLAFFRHACASGSRAKHVDLHFSEFTDFQNFAFEVLLESLSQDKPEMLMVYLLLYHLAMNLLHTRQHLQPSSVRLLSCYCATCAASCEREPLLQPSFEICLRNHFFSRDHNDDMLLYAYG